MPVYQSPGVYVEETPSAVKPIAGVSTSTAAFIGIVPDELKLVARGQPDANGRPTTKLVNFRLPLPDKAPALITNWTQFTKQFGDLVGDSAAEGVHVENPAVDEGHRNLAHAAYGFFNNGGSRCYVARIKPTSDPLGFDPADLDAALKALEAIDEIALVAAPGMIDGGVRARLVAHCNTTGDRFAILDGPKTDDPPNPPAGVQPSDMAASYFPWIKVFDPANALKDPNGDGQLEAPPSGHIAGVYARVDAQRGVFKSPANEPILGALGVSQMISKADQDNLNPAGVNCIRLINGAVMVWGARTLGGKEEFSGAAPTSGYLADAVAGFFDNGGERCYVVLAAHTDAAEQEASLTEREQALRAGIDALARYDDLDLLAAPDAMALRLSSGAVFIDAVRRLQQAMLQRGALSNAGSKTRSTVGSEC